MTRHSMAVPNRSGIGLALMLTPGFLVHDDRKEG